MKPRELLDILAVAERLKDVTRHCYTSGGRHESVAEHCWMTSLMAFLLKEEFPEADMDKVIRMCLIHDLGEAFTGDIPVFQKTQEDEEREEQMLYDWVRSLPKKKSEEMLALYGEMEALQTLEAKIYKSIDGLEAVVQHNFSDISTWLPNEYQLNQTYARNRVGFSPYLTQLRELMGEDTLQKIREAEAADGRSLPESSEKFT